MNDIGTCERCSAAIDAPSQVFWPGAALLVLLGMIGPNVLCRDCASLYGLLGMLALGAVLAVGALVVMNLV